MQSSSSSSNANTASPLTFVDAGSDDPTVRPKRKRKRTMAGYQLKQTTTGTETFLPHQQQREPGTIPPIKLRRVTDNSWRVVGSSTGEQGSGVPLAGEPDMPADAASRGAAVVGSLSGNPPTASDNSPLTGDAQTSTMAQDMPGPMDIPEPMDMPGHIESVPPTTAPDLDKLISEFTVSQQNNLRTHLTKPEIQAVLNNAEILLKTLNDRNIKLSRDRGKPPAHSLFSKLKSLNIVKEPSIFSGYFARANVFFSAVNTQQITNTSCLTSMLKSKTHIKQFAEKSEETIQTVAANPCLKQICSMFNGKGLPDNAKVEDFPVWECWKVNGQFSLELLRAFSSMMSGRGLPDKGKVEDFLARECWKVNGQFSLERLRAFSSMMSGRGLPDKGKVEDLLAWECWKVNGQFNLELLRAFSSMCHGKGLPDKAKVEDFLALECWKVNGQFSLELLRAVSSMHNSKGLPDSTKVKDFPAWECWKVNGQFSLELLRAFSSMMSGRGLPDKGKVEDFLAWQCWKVNGQFNLELLRAFSSMCHGKGLPDKAKVEDFLAWQCWKVNGQFSLELLRAVSSMMSSRGLPHKGKVEDFLAWQCWKANGQFSLELLRAFSSMCHGKGLPDKAKVEDFLAWQCWKVNGEFSLELLRAVSSMMSSRGLPDKGKVEDFLAWQCWKVNGQFSLELLRVFSSMYNGKGLPDKGEVEDFLAWECWKMNGQFSLELLRAVSSMHNGKGLPDKGKVEDFLAWECWKVNGEFSPERLRAVSSMHNGKGLPDKGKVEDFLAWECWKVNGEFSLELLPAVSSMCHGKGLPDKGKVEDFLAWQCWKVNGQFSLELLRAVSSMYNGKGLPDKGTVEDFQAWVCWKVNGQFSLELLHAFSSMMGSRGLPDKGKVEDFLAWQCWKVNGQFSLELLRTVSSMCHGKGLPDKGKVEDFLAWKCWKVNGQFSLELLRAVSSMYNGKGLPDKAKVEAFFDWLPSDEKKNLLKLACRLFSGFGVPSREKLTDNEKTLRQSLKESGYFTDSENDSSDEEDDLLEAGQMRALALFLSAPAKWQMNIADFQHYLNLTASKSPRNQRMVVRAAVTSLLPILAIHGGSGIRFWIEMHHKKPDCKEFLTRALTIPAPLALTTFALTQLPESEGQEYIGLCRNMKPAPTPEQWDALKPLRQQLYQRFRNTPLQRMMLEILWSQSGDNRSKYTDRMDDLFQVVPTMTQWYRIYRAMGSQKQMQQFMDACLDYQGAPETTPEVRIQQRLLEGLLLANHYLTDHEDIPDLCFSSRVSGDDKTGVIIDGAGTMTGQERLWHFISAMLIELQQTEYQFTHQRLTLSPPDGQPVVLPTPEFTATVTGFVIKNWSLEQLNAFFKATEFTEQWYKAPQDKREHYAIRLEENLAQMKARAQETKEAEKTEKTEKAGHKKTGPLLSPSMIIGLIKQNKPLKSTVWSSLEHYASNGQLTGSLCKVLSPVIKREKEGIVPDIVKNTVAAKLSQSDTINTPAVSTTPQPLPSASRAAAASNNTVQPIATFKAAMDALDRFQVLGNAELEMLEVYREEMGTTQLMSVLKKINHKTVSQQTQNAWSTAFERRKKDPLGLEDIQEWGVDLSASDSEPQSEQWLEEILS